MKPLESTCLSFVCMFLLSITAPVASPVGGSLSERISLENPSWSDDFRAAHENSADNFAFNENIDNTENFSPPDSFTQLENLPPPSDNSDPPSWPPLQPWTGEGWSYRRPITITNTAQALTNYQVLVTLDTASLISAGKMQPGGLDIRFVVDNSTIPHWVESGMNTASTKIWMRVPSIPVGSSTIYIYYGNPSATSAENGTATFIYFNDFELETTGTPPAGWTSGEYPTSAAVSEELPFTGLKSLRLVRKTGESGGIWIDLALPTGFEIFLKARANAARISRFGPAAWYGAFSGWPVRMPMFDYTFSPNREMTTRVDWGSPVHTGHSFTPGQWHRLNLRYTGERILLNMDEGTPFSIALPSRNFSGIALHMDWAGADPLFVDELVVRKYAEPEPLVEVGAEEADTMPPVSSVNPIEP